ncbi:hypothetical protein, partial [Heyndrickxia sporothermodurans]
MALVRSHLRSLLVVVALSTFTTAVWAQTPAVGPSNLSLGRDVDQHLRAVRERARELVATAASIPDAAGVAATRLLADDRTTLSALVIRLLLLWFGGWLAERLFWRWAAAWMQRIVDSPLATARQRFAAQAQRLLFAQGLVLTFATGACLTYLIAAPPGAAGVMALDALLA